PWPTSPISPRRNTNPFCPDCDSKAPPTPRHRAPSQSAEYKPPDRPSTKSSAPSPCPHPPPRVSPQDSDPRPWDIFRCPPSDASESSSRLDRWAHWFRPCAGRRSLCCPATRNNCFSPPTLPHTPNRYRHCTDRPSYL